MNRVSDHLILGEGAVPAAAGTAVTAINVKIGGHDEKPRKRIEISLLVAGTSLVVFGHYLFGFWAIRIKALGERVSWTGPQLLVLH